jgi:hypothetical protein
MVKLRKVPNSNRVLHIKGNVSLTMLKKRLQSKKEEKVKITFFSFCYAHIERVAFRVGMEKIFPPWVNLF